MLKREVPFTPEPLGAKGKKKQKEYLSPSVNINRTPLRNVASSLSVMNSPLGASVAAVGGLVSSPRTPLNDDELERRQNRKEMAKSHTQMKKNLHSPALTTKVRAQPANLVLTPKSRQQQLERLLPQSPLVSAKAVNAPVTMTMEQRNRVFEEWMKIAADNKINSKNSWNVALIDYFSELTFLRDGDSINFQKASCTLDGCVKIYSTRVDSVADETNKLLNGLADGAAKNKNNKFSPDSMMMDADGMEREGDDEIEEGKKRVSSKRPHKSVDTLEKSFEALNLKQMDVAFAVDPLFKKTCAEFDESGSKGFLTSNITLGPSGKLLFDSAGAPSFDDKDDAVVAIADVDEVDITSLLQLLGSEFAEIEMKPISPSLGDYNLTAPASTNLDKGLTETLSKLTELTTELNNRMDIDNDDSNSDSDIEPDVGLGVGVGLQQLIADEDIVPMNDEYEVYDDLEAMPMGSSVVPESSAVCNPASVQLPGAITKSASQGIQQLEVITDMAEVDDGEPNLFSYFDGNLQRNWAGPEHWKIRRPHLMLGRDKGQVDPSTAGTRQPKAAKKEFVLDFDCETIDFETIFVKANPASITLTRSAIDSRSENNNLLPEDLHFSSTELVRLFLKPSWSLTGKRITTITRSVPLTVENTVTDHAQSADVQNTEELPADYWTNNAAVPLSNDYFDPDDVVYDDNDKRSGDLSAEGDLPLPDAPIHSNIMDHGKDLVPTFKSTSAISINYARVAKRVDVQELKRVMWDEFEKLSLLSASKPSSGKDKTKQMTDSPAPTTLTSLITSLPQTNISKETLQDVSVSYCFICLLHLANEHNLELRDENEEIQVCPSK